MVQPGEPEQTTASGLVMPDTAAEKPQQGLVLAVGRGGRSDQTGVLIPMAVEVGATIVYARHSGTEITIDGQDVLVFSARDVLATITSPPRNQQGARTTAMATQLFDEPARTHLQAGVDRRWSVRLVAGRVDWAAWSACGSIRARRPLVRGG